MQIEYDVDLFAGPYADCFDHVQNHGTFGLKTALTVGSTLYQGCVGGSVTVGGRLDIFDGEYGRERGSPPNGSFHLDGNPLASRVLTFTKSGAGAGTATATTASGNNWSKTFPYTSLGTFQFTVVFDRDANTILMRRGLDSAPLRTFTISWQVNNPC